MKQIPALFDLNGSFGLPVTGQPEFATANQLLAHLDRLGVSRSLVWHVAARDHHADTGNRQLLTEIAGQQDRLIPAFTVGTDMLWARNGLTELTAALAAKPVRALRFFPATLRYNAAQITPVIEAVASHKPVLLCDVRELADLGTLAERFPQLPVVLTHMMWGHMTMLFDLMRRHENVHADISWIHTGGTIELLCREFGAARVLFGLGGRAHQGASIAALLHAEISDADRDRIAHGNLDKLLGLPATQPRRATITQPLWQRFIRHEPLGIEIMDAHGHLGPTSTWMVERQELADQIPQALRDMDRLGIRTLIASGMHALFNDPVAGNDLLAKAIQPHGDRLRGWIAFNPNHADRLTPHVDRWLANPVFAGFKLLCGYWRVPITDPRLEIVWRTANAHRLPILIHTWDGGHDSPAMLRDICPKYPDAAFLLAHAGGGDRGRREAEDLVAGNPNVWLEWCGSFCSSIPWEGTLPKVGAGRVLFGTDAVLHNFAWELGRLLSLDLPEEMLRPILGANLRGLLERRK